MSDDKPRIPEEILRHYEEEVDEGSRLSTGLRQLELLRTQEIVRRHLPRRLLQILDVGGASGVHAAWLADDGHQVHLVDPVDRHVRRALELAASRAHRITAEVGDSRQLRQQDETYDAVLLLGPLYHLTERSDRIRSLTEARRVVRPGGLVFAAAISRFASLFDGLASGFLLEPGFRSIVDRDLREGQHRNPERHPEWFTTAFFHHPDELHAEIESVGLAVRDIIGVEGLAHWIHTLEEGWSDPDIREMILYSAQATEKEPSLRGLSAHLLAVAARP